MIGRERTNSVRPCRRLERFEMTNMIVMGTGVERVVELELCLLGAEAEAGLGSKLFVLFRPDAAGYCIEQGKSRQTMRRLHQVRGIDWRHGRWSHAKGGRAKMGLTTSDGCTVQPYRHPPKQRRRTHGPCTAIPRYVVSMRMWTCSWGREGS